MKSQFETFNWDEKFFEPEGHFSLVIVGGRYSGKSTLLKSIWSKMKKKFDLIVVFCNNPQAEIYNEMFSEDDKKFIFEDYESSILEDLNKYQRITDNSLNICILFDDCSSNQKNKYDNNLIQLFIRGRNINTTIIFSTQYINFINKSARANIDYLVILDPKTFENQIMIIDKFLVNVIPLPEVVRDLTVRKQKLWLADWLKKNTMDHKMLVIDYRNANEIYSYFVKKPQ